MNEEELKLFENIYELGIGECPTDDIKQAGLIFDKVKNIIKENKELKDKINNFNLEIGKWLEDSKVEMREYGNNHEKYWAMFNQLLNKIKNKLVDISNYAVIDRKREEELLNTEYILTEFEKWLDEETKKAHFSLIEALTLQRCLDKLQELKEGKK